MNARLRTRAVASVARCAERGPGAVEQRLHELDHEWNVERALETNFAAVVLVGLGLGAYADRRWYAVTAAAAGFMLQHALFGWCPPLAVLRRFGVRTASEIATERYALKALRGDFLGIAGLHSREHIGEALEATE